MNRRVSRRPNGRRRHKSTVTPEQRAARARRRRKGQQASKESSEAARAYYNPPKPFKCDVNAEHQGYCSDPECGMRTIREDTLRLDARLAAQRDVIDVSEVHG